MRGPIRILITALLLLTVSAFVQAQTATMQFVAPPKSTVSWTSATANNTAVTVTTTNLSVVLVTLSATSTMTGGTLNFEGDDGSAVWWANPCTRTGGASTTGANETTFALAVTTQTWTCDVSGYTSFRVRLSPAITGTGTASIAMLGYAGASVPSTTAVQPTASAFNATVQPGNTANTTPWLFTPYQNSATLFGNATALNASSPLSTVTSTYVGALLYGWSTGSSNWQAIVPNSIATTNTTAQTTGDQLFVIGSSSAPTAVTTGNSVGIWGDLNGRVHIAGDASAPAVPVSGTFWQATQPVTFASGAVSAGAYAVGSIPPAAGALKAGVTAAMTGTTSTQVIAAVASNYLYISSCSVNNTHASVDTLVNLQDGSGGTTIWTFTAPHGYGGESHPFPTPLRVPTLGNGLYAADVTTGASVIISCQGFASTTAW